jgi:uncharacterized DUF497 family protein
VVTVICGDFEWDAEKAEQNLVKHGVSFEEAATALVDPRAIFLADESTGEQRAIAIGMSERARVLFVVHVERGERDRIISARVATRAEESLYAEGY